MAATSEVDTALRGLPGVLALKGQPEVVAALSARLNRLDEFRAAREAELDANAGELSADALETANAELFELADVLWAIRNDRFRTAREVEALAGRDASDAALAAYLVAQQAFSAIDRLEVRGRDSAGIHFYVWGHDIDSDTLAALVAERGNDPLFENGSVVADTRRRRSAGPLVRLQTGRRDRRARRQHRRPPRGARRRCAVAAGGVLAATHVPR